MSSDEPSEQTEENAPDGDVTDGTDTQQNEVTSRGRSDLPTEGASPRQLSTTRRAPNDTQSFYKTYRQSIDRFTKLREFDVRCAALGEYLTSLNARLAACWLDQLIRGALWGREPELDVVLSASFWLLTTEEDDTHYGFVRQIYQLAHEHDFQTVIAFLRSPPPHRTLAEAGELPDVRLPMERDDITVGERRALARGRDDDVLDRLLFDPDPLVIRNLVQNPRMTPSDIVRTAARRPNTPEILREIVTVPRWFSRSKIRRALLLNPYNDTGVSMKLLPTVGISTVRKVRFGSDVHPLLVEAAEYLVDLRESHTDPWNV